MPELFEILTFDSDQLAAPVNIQESDGVVTVLAASAPTVDTGKYRVSLTFVSTYTSLNDRLHFNIAGTHSTPTFMKEAKDALESMPWAYSFIVDGDGTPITANFNAWIDGIGNANVTIEEANITIERVI